MVTDNMLPLNTKFKIKGPTGPMLIWPKTAIDVNVLFENMSEWKGISWYPDTNIQILS